MRAEVAGSSPLTRGKPSLGVSRGNVLRLIPAHAGKTVRPSSVLTPDRAHPRSRGENAWPGRFAILSRGSSPLTRGKLGAVGVGERVVRLIPAHAGKTRGRRRRAGWSAAHPRSRGENGVQKVEDGSEEGSSPLTRGKLPGRAGDDSGPWLIPAHAGKTSSLITLPSKRGAHPRSRGENPPHADNFPNDSGSSPLTRGKQAFGEDCAGEVRLIPAHAGKTHKNYPHCEMSRAHPRSRRENTPAARLPATITGSSPLTRGKHARLARTPRPAGLIPAHAGKTAAHALAEIVARAHPRSRGENAASPGPNSSDPGSSPLTRGKPRPRLALSCA